MPQATLASLTTDWVLTERLPRLDFQLLVMHVLGITQTDFFLLPQDLCFSAEETTALTELLTRRAADEPLAYLTGTKEFFGEAFTVTPDTLIPRPDSECLIEDILAYSKLVAPKTILDIGTGSGALIITLAKHIPGAQCFGSDVSKAALTVAQKNIYTQQSSATLLEGGFLLPYTDTLLHTAPVFIIANLPYVSETLFAQTETTVHQYEPTLALLSSSDGLAHYYALLQQVAARTLPKGTALWLEISPEQTEALTNFIQTTFPEATLTIGQDLANRDRFVRIVL
jgi:release factor glutamine methyltransferase